MRLNQVDLNLFVVFDAIYTERNLSRAADILCITQPAVSNALARLRRTFDDQLFIRTAEGMKPTPVAENVVNRVRQALSLLNNSVQEGHSFDPGAADKTFVLSMNGLAEVLMLPPLLQSVQTAAPGLRIQSHYFPRNDVGKGLASGTIDMAVDVPLPDAPQICRMPLTSERYVCALRKGHPLARDSLTLDEYLSLQHVHVSQRRKGGGHADVALNALGVSRNVQVRVQNYMSVPGLIEVSDLAWTLPECLAIQCPELHTVSLPFEMATMEWQLYWHASADGDQANRWMREQLVSLALMNS